MTIEELNRMCSSLKSKRKPRHLESEIQQSCISWFRFAFPQYIIAAIPNGGSRNAIEAANLKKEGVLAGFADLIIIADHKILFVEMKTRKGKQRESQKEFQKKVEKLGFKYVICRSLDEFMIAVNGWLGKGTKQTKTIAIEGEWSWGTSIHIVTDDGRGLLKVCIDDTVAGNANREEAEISDLNVHELYRRKGYAKALMRDAERNVMEKGCKRLCLWVECGSWMEGWYKRLGFEEKEMWSPPYPNTKWMVKFLRK